ALEEVGEMMHRIRELVIQADNGVNNALQQDYIDQEVSALGAEIGNVLTNTEFNDKAPAHQRHHHRPHRVGRW
ncbi:MAG TPA: hypothetical protein HPP91_07680, partial [Gammaproteobacteria bacterium]|nr:hypothetical protein [Gammaproteobacteria bacterium]